MSYHPHLARPCSFQISSSLVNGPLNLLETVLSAQTSEPEWLNDQSAFTDIEVLNGTPVKYAVSQRGGVDEFILNVTVLGIDFDNQIIQNVRSHLIHVLGLGDDLPLFYRTFDDDEPLRSTFLRLRGLRLMQGTNLFESLIFSILSQNSSARKMNTTARLLMQNYGSRVRLPDGSVDFLFPSAKRLAKSTEVELRAKTSMGYRAKSVLEVSKQVSENRICLDRLAGFPYDEASRILLDLPGVGPKVADCFLLYGLGRLEAAPVDVWIHRIVSELYFKGKKISRLMTARFLRERFGIWAGYAQLYLFDYARRGVFHEKNRAKRAKQS